MWYQIVHLAGGDLTCQSMRGGGSIVIAPSVWFKESFKGDSRGACRDDMVKLDVGGNKIEN